MRCYVVVLSLSIFLLFCLVVAPTILTSILTHIQFAFSKKKIRHSDMTKNSFTPATLSCLNTL